MLLHIFVSMLSAALKNKYKGKDLNYLENKLQDLINSIVRRRDSVNGFFVCIACDELKPVNQLNASHYYPKEPKQYKAVRFDLDNIHGGCIRCNKYLHGNLLPYRKNLIEKIGIERFERLEKLSELKNFKYDREFLIINIERLKSKN